MPFVKKTDSQSPQPPTDAHKIFIGRKSELLFFVENILKPADPTHNIISIWGQGGVGKSTLLARFIDETHAPEFKDYCLTAMVDERQTSPASIMEKFADQLDSKGEFEKALKRYKEALRNLQTKREAMQDAFLDKTPDFTGAAMEGIPFAGPILREGAKVVAEHLADKYRTSYMHRDAERLEDPIDDLTKAFIEELNRLADIQVVNSTRRTNRRRRVILFFDTFEQLSADAGPWLLDYFLESNISSNVVLIVSGRDSIERSTPNDPKRWLPYLDNHIIHSIPLDSFTPDETRSYLDERGITDPERIETIWQLSHGLPLYLGFLTSNPWGKVDPTANVVANFLRWIPEQEPVKRQLALDAALFSRPFNLDDLEAFTYLSEEDRLSNFHWLIGQPFVRPQDGRYSYHDLARDLFSRHLYQRSQKAYYSTRRVLASHYQRLIERIQREEGKEVYRSTEWLELVLGLVLQLFFLPDNASHIKGIEQVLNANRSTSTEQRDEIVRVLRELSLAQPTNQANISARQIAEQLRQYIEAKLESQEFLAAANYLIEKVVHAPTFPSQLMARLNHKRGRAYRNLKDYKRALKDFDRAIELDPQYAQAYSNRGVTYHLCVKYDKAIKDFDRALELDPNNDSSYALRGTAYRALKDYQSALQDFDRLLELKPNDAPSYVMRGIIYGELKDHQRALQDFDHALELKPDNDWASARRGETYRLLRDYQHALQDFDRAIELDSEYDWAYAQRGETYRLLKEYQRAIQDFDRAIELDPEYDWAYGSRGQVYSSLEQYDQAIKDFDRAIELDPNLAWVYSNRGQNYGLRKEYDQAIKDFDRAIALDPEYAWAYIERSETYRFCEDYQRAILDCTRALALDPTYARAYAERGADYKELKDYHLAIDDFDQAIKLDPNYAWAYVERSETYRFCEDYQRAILDCNQALALDPTYARVYAERGADYKGLEDYPRAIEDLNHAIELDPNYAWAYAQRGATYSSLKDYQHAIQDFDRAIELNPNYAWAYDSRGQVYFSLKEYERAIQDFDRAIELDPNNAWIFTQRGIAYKALNDYQRAIEDFKHVLELHSSLGQILYRWQLEEDYQLALQYLNHAIELHPHFAWAYIERGKSYLLLEDYQQAIEDFDRAIVLEPNNDVAFANRGETYRLRKEYNQAIKDFDMAIELDPKYAWAYGSRGQVYSSLKEYERAIQDFDRAIELDPELDWVYGERGDAYQELTNYQRAIQDFDRALELDPNYAWIYAQRGAAYKALNDNQRAIEDFNHVLELDSSLGRILYWWQLEKDYQLALQYLNHAIELHPDYAWAYAQRGIAHRELEDYQRALQDFDHAIELDPKLSWVYDARSLTHLWLRDIKHARIDLSRSLELEPTDIETNWDIEWSGICLERTNPGISERLEAIATINPQNRIAYVCRGTALYLHGRLNEARAELEQAIILDSEKCDAYFWKGMVCASLGQEEEAIAAIEKSLELELPPVLLTPLRWFEQDRPVFYEKHAAPLLARYNV